jgi:hypothetical protein
MPISSAQLPTIADARGSLSFIEGGRHIPFPIARVFYLYGVAVGAPRGGHAHRECHQFLFAIAGSFDVTLDDGRAKRSFTLNRPNEGLHVPPMIWLDLAGFSETAVCCVLASHAYDEADYLRDYRVFEETVS